MGRQRGVRGDFLEKLGLSKNGMCPYEMKKGTVSRRDCPLFRGYGEGGERAFYFREM